MKKGEEIWLLGLIKESELRKTKGETVVALVVEIMEGHEINDDRSSISSNLHMWRREC
jgi:hypothetical protein